MKNLIEGGRDVVCKVEDIKLKHIVALKFLLPETLGSEEDENGFLLKAKPLHLLIIHINEPFMKAI